jgi:hypothetical protein
MRSGLPASIALGTMLLSACAPSQEAKAPASAGLPFIADDYPSALALARERDVPLFIESWAPW